MTVQETIRTRAKELLESGEVVTFIGWEAGRFENQTTPLVITDAAKQFVADAGFDIQYGARPLKRAIQTHIEDPMSELLLKHEDMTAATITIDVKDGEIVATIKK